MKEPFHPEPLTAKEKNILVHRYRTLYIAADEVFQKHPDSRRINNLIWYKVCTNSNIYSTIKEIIQFAFSFLVHDQNKCFVESLIGDIQHIDSSDRSRLNREIATLQEIIKQNGPHPLLSEDLR